MPKLLRISGNSKQISSEFSGCTRIPAALTKKKLENQSFVLESAVSYGFHEQDSFQKDSSPVKPLNNEYSGQ